LYYASWGFIGGAAVGRTALSRNGAPSSSVIYAGAAVFAVGEIGNAWAHWHLRQLRKGFKAIGTGKYVIPSAGPFGYITCPHYTFELVSWLGYAIMNGFDAASISFIAMSITLMGSFVADRHAKYTKMEKDGHWDGKGVPPSKKWKIVPFVW